MSTTELTGLTPAEKRWDFSRDAVTHGRLVAWGSELAVATALVAPLADIPWEAGAGAGVVCTGAAVLYEKARGSWRRVQVARATSWLATTGWLSYTLATQPTLLTMAFGGAIWATGAAVNIGMDKWGEETRAAEKELDRRLETGEQIKKAQDGWAKLLEDICGIEGAVADPVIDRWRSGAGYTVKITLPAHMNVDALRGYEAALAGALHLPKGGGVSFNAGGPTTPRNVVFIAVTEKNMMSGAIPYPKLTPTTINKPVGFGVIGNGEEAGLNLKDEGFIAIGAQGSGKTALMKTLGLGLVRCVDAIVIDLDTSAKMSAVFVNPWLRHGIGVPLIDWPCTTEDECRLAVRAARDAIAARKTEYADLMEDEDIDNLPARPDIPAIHIRVDETKSMPDDVLEGIDFIIEEGRSVNVRVSNTGLRATRDYITAAMDELTPGRIGLRTNNSTELDMLYPGHGAPDMAIFTDPGTVVYMSATKGPFQPVPAKAYATMAEAFTEGTDDFNRMSTLFMDAARQLSDIRPADGPDHREGHGPGLVAALGPHHPQPARRLPRQRRRQPHARIRVGAVPVVGEARLLRPPPGTGHRRRRRPDHRALLRRRSRHPPPQLRHARRRRTRPARRTGSRHRTRQDLPEAQVERRTRRRTVPGAGPPREAVRGVPADGQGRLHPVRPHLPRPVRETRLQDKLDQGR
jgi:hypothetical protein